MLAAAALAGCGGGGSGGGSENGEVTIYRTGFDGSPSSRWLTQTSDDPANCAALPVQVEASGNTYAVSRGPWWTDTNHSSPGLGYLHLVAFAYHRDWSSDGVVSAGFPGRPIDLRNAEVVVRWRAPTLQLPVDAKLLFWFQTHDPARPRTDPRYVNYVLANQPLTVQPGSGAWRETRLELSTAAGAFRCLGSNADRADTYGCSSDVNEALRSWSIDLGFVILFPDATLAEQIQGSVEFDELSLQIPDGNVDTHVFAEPTLQRGPSTCRFDHSS